MDDHIKHKYWNPRLIELTQIGGVLELDGGQPTACFVDPRNIGLVSRVMGGFYKPGTVEFYSLQPCTMVSMGVFGNIHVLESPREVALRRDRALELPVQLRGVE